MGDESFDTPFRGGFVRKEHRFALTVYFEDTDAYGVVYHANYLKFIERARSDMLRAAGVDQTIELRQSGSAYAVIEVSIRYVNPARLNDDLLIISRITQVRASSVDIQQRVMRGPELLAHATVKAAFLDGQGRPRRQPNDWIEKYKAVTTKR